MTARAGRPTPRLGTRAVRAGVLALAGALFAYLALAYLVLPAFWSEDEARRPPGSSWITRTAEGLPGDPVNVALTGSRKDVVAAMTAAGWHPADPVTVETSLRIAESVVLDRPDPDAPVSPLYLDGRRQDQAFEKAAGSSAERRSHVRLWRAAASDPPTWLGAATFDDGVGFSHYTGAVTHDIAPDVDAARDGLASDLRAAGKVAATRWMEASGATRDGRNGEGDRYVTDGRALVLDLAPAPGS